MDNGYYTRSRGKINGPFSQVDLQKLVRRGALSRTDQVSSDRQTWMPAGDFGELFPAAPVRAERAGPPGRRQAAATATVEADDEDSAPARAEPESLKYYYAQNGVAVGPVPAAVLVALARNRTLGAADLVWQDGRETGTPASQLSLLAAHFSESYDRPGDGGPFRMDPEALRRAAMSAGGVSLSWGLTVGIMIVLFLNLPIMSVNGKTLWCWSAVGERGTGLFVTFCFFLLVAGVVLCLVAPLARGVGRGVVFIVLSGATGLLLAVTALASDNPASELTGVAGTYFVPAFAAMLLAACQARRLDPTSSGAQISQGIFAGLAGGCAVVVGIVLVVEAKGIRLLPEAIIAGYVVMIFAYAVAMAAGILGVTAAAKAFSGGLNLATMICAACGSVLIALALLLFYLGFVDAANIGREFASSFGTKTGPSGPTAAAVFLLLFRLVAIFAGMAALAGVGLFEVLLAPGAQPVRRGRPSGNAAAAAALNQIR